ncbi:hypothetical protein E2320_009408 [Naja naja]|nr:hypothetical protein E2320_009408 [Naja naja]
MNPLFTTERCHHPVDPGHCEAHMTRFYYNHKYKKCKKFIYGGCKGNDNNFESFEECLHFCKEKPGVCPKAPPDLITICPVKCGSDWDCHGRQKCCPYGCMVDCMDPV